jgi:ABC-type Fe3+/spermidine/putrescine transport system ATPase subunit
MSPPFLRLQGLTKSFGELRVLEGVDLEVAEGEMLALLGPSGSGKTTLLRILAGFETSEAGRIEAAGRDVAELPPARRGFGMVFQHYALFPHLDVAGNVGFGLRSRGVGRDQIARRVEEVLALVDLADFQTRPLRELSGGQQQRVAVARALAPEPQLLLLDEPLSNLDPGLRERTRKALKSLVRRLGITTLLVTHEQQEAFELGDRIAVLHHGRLQQVGTAEEIYQRPSNRFVARFVGRANLLRGHFLPDGSGAVVLEGLGAGAVWPGEAAHELVAGEPVELMLRPEALAFCAPGEDGAVSGEVAERLFGGGSSLFRVAVDGGEVEVVARSGAAREGERVAVRPGREGPLGRIWRQGASAGGEDAA